MPKKTHRTPQLWKQAPAIMLGIASVVGSFAIGIRTAGDVQTIAPSQAGGTIIAGDVNHDGQVTLRDAIVILEVTQYGEATPDQLLADPNGDGQLTVDDALRILHDLAP